MSARDEARELALKQALEARTYWLQRAEAAKSRNDFRGCIAQATLLDSKIRKLDPSHKLRDKLFADPETTPAVLGLGERKGTK